jgi:hypothetical protein
MSIEAGKRSSHGRRVARFTGDEREAAILATAERLLGQLPWSAHFVLQATPRRVAGAPARLSPCWSWLPQGMQLSFRAHFCDFIVLFLWWSLVWNGVDTVEARRASGGDVEVLGAEI